MKFATRKNGGRSALVTATTGLLVGLALLDGRSSNAVGGLCNGRPASETWLDASGQYGPTLIDGTNQADDIIGSDSADVIDAGGGHDLVCGAAGDDSIHGGHGDDVIRGDAGDDDLDGGDGADTVVGDGGNDTVAGGPDPDVIVGGSGDDVMISTDDNEEDKVEAGDDFDVCLFSGADELDDCEYSADLRGSEEDHPHARRDVFILSSGQQ